VEWHGQSSPYPLLFSRAVVTKYQSVTAKRKTVSFFFALVVHDRLCG
jgi:hypothetical protein